MTLLKIRAIDEVSGVILPQELLEKHHLKHGDSLSLIENTDGSFKLTVQTAPHDAAFETQMQAANEGMAQYNNALRELAK